MVKLRANRAGDTQLDPDELEQLNTAVGRLTLISSR
jgi:hypothetical protein